MNSYSGLRSDAQSISSPRPDVNPRDPNPPDDRCRAGELTLGIVLMTAALLWAARWSRMGFTGRRIVLTLIVLSGVAAIFMNINFHLAGGANHPWLLAADPNGEGVDLDSLMPIIQTIISGVAFVFLRRHRSARPAAFSQPVASAARA